MAMGLCIHLLQIGAESLKELKDWWARIEKVLIPGLTSKAPAWTWSSWVKTVFPKPTSDIICSKINDNPRSSAGQVCDLLRCLAAATTTMALNFRAKNPVLFVLNAAKHDQGYIVSWWQSSLPRKALKAINWLLDHASGLTDNRFSATSETRLLQSTVD